MKYITIAILSMFLHTSAHAQLSFSTPKNNPVELGKVNWLRDYDQAVTNSKKEGKPVFILFQEVPGCATCQNFGNDVLSHPFIVEMIETHFTPLAVFNNVKGKDRETLNKFKEPTWNNPVIRVVNSNGKDIVERLGRQWTELGVSYSITNALEETKKETPHYFKLYQEELIGRSGEVKEANLAMYCFWTGEKELAKVEGVLSTEPGYMNGHEVVKIEYNPYITNLETIVPVANRVNCADEVYVDEKIKVKVPVKKTGAYRKDRDDKYYLSRTPYKLIPMTNLQAAKVNSAIGSRQAPEQYLSPRQIELFNYLKNKKTQSQIGVDLEQGWSKLIVN